MKQPLIKPKEWICQSDKDLLRNFSRWLLFTFLALVAMICMVSSTSRSRASADREYYNSVTNSNGENIFEFQQP